MENVIKLYTASFIERALNVKRSKAVKLMKEEMNGFKVGNDWRVDKRDFEIFLKNAIDNRGRK